MIIIQDDTVYNCSKIKGAKMLGVHVNTVAKWEKKGTPVFMNNCWAYFKYVQIKQNKGFGIKKK